MIAHQQEINFAAGHSGSDYRPEHDAVRLAGQLARIWDLMLDGKWRTLSEISERTGDSTASISAQLRHLRKPRFGANEVSKRRRGDPGDGLFEYRVIPSGRRVVHV